MNEHTESVTIGATNADGSPGDLSVLDDQNIMYDVTKATIDLTKEEKRRTTALFMAIQAYQGLIIKDADYLREVYNQQRAGNGPVIQPATMNAMVQAAIEFDEFISGRLQAEIDRRSQIVEPGGMPDTNKSGPGIRDGGPLAKGGE